MRQGTWRRDMRSGHEARRARPRLTPLALRPRRPLVAALLCAGLVAALLPMASRVAHATANDIGAEVDDEANADVDDEAGIEVDVERLAGTTRYETAVAIAERYAVAVGTAAGAVGTEVDTVIVVPGEDEHAACVLPAAAVAAERRAPILLTASAELTPATEMFIKDHGIGHAVILGGQEAVSAAIADRLAQLTGRAPLRLGGAGCADTALAVARHLGSAGVIGSVGSSGSISAAGALGGRGRTALLATDVSAADGLAAGPLAYRGRLPLLLAHDGELEGQVIDYLAGRVDHVIVFGGSAAVSEAAVRSLQARGVTTERWHGTDRYGTAARVAAELLGERSPVRCFDGDGVGLATGYAAADAVASAPLLGERCDPLLLAAPSRLPDATAAALGADTFGGDAARALRLTIFGGTAAIGRAVERAAIAAATGADEVGRPPVSAMIDTTEGACHWTVTFSEPVRTADAEDVGNYTFGGKPLSARIADIDGSAGSATTQAVVLLAGAGAYTSAEVPTGCAMPVAVRDRLAVVGGAIRATAGRRTVEASELIVQADTTRPRLSVFAPPGGQAVWVRSSEPLTAGRATVTLTRGRARKTQTVTTERGDTSFKVTFGFPEHDSYTAAELPFTEPPWLHAADKITVGGGRLRDWAGNTHLTATHTVRADTTPPRVSGFDVSAPVAGPDGTFAVDIAIRWSEPVRGCGLGPSGPEIDLSKMQIDVDADGFVDFSLDGYGTSSAGISFVAAPDGNEWAVAGSAACDWSWQERGGTLVGRLAALTLAALPGADSTLVVLAGAAHDFAGNPTAVH